MHNIRATLYRIEHIIHPIRHFVSNILIFYADAAKPQLYSQTELHQRMELVFVDLLEFWWGSFCCRCSSLWLEVALLVVF